MIINVFGIIICTLCLLCKNLPKWYFGNAPIKCFNLFNDLSNIVADINQLFANQMRMIAKMIILAEFTR